MVLSPHPLGRITIYHLLAIEEINLPKSGTGQPSRTINAIKLQKRKKYRICKSKPMNTGTDRVSLIDKPF